MRIYLASSLLFIFVAYGLAAQPVDRYEELSPKPTPTPASTDKGKKNLRPDTDTSRNEQVSRSNDPVAAGTAVYLYEFTRPGFTYSRVLIEHDEEGRGKISFVKDGSEEQITDPIALSVATMNKIRHSLSELDFLNSTEDYQYERDFSNLGNMAFTVRKDGRERTVRYNWTANKNAKDLMDEYRRISNEYTWLFEFDVARVNQPLRTPGMMDSLDSYLKRNEIPDPPHLIPFLAAISTDERLPLITRNRALKLTGMIEKAKK